MTSKRTIIIGIVIFLSFFLAGWWSAQNLNFSLLSLTDLDSREVNQNDKNKYEVALIYIGSSTCDFCNSERVKNAFHAVRSNLKYRMNQYGYSFTTIGISKDKIVTEGLLHLSEYGDFDEVMTGNGWSNSGILKYIYGKIPGQAATPQILVTFRKYRSINTDHISAYRGIEKEKLVLRKVGVREITKWSNTPDSTYLPEESLAPF